jgi:NADH dehydrogenase
MNKVTAVPEANVRVPRVVIVGAGFGGLSTAKALARAPVDITLIDRQNYHLFQPLLYQVATASLSPGDIAWPIRRILRGQCNVRVLLGEVTAIESRDRTVTLAEQRIAYDCLILATGVRHDYFGHADWEALAPGLKELDDATGIRRRILLAFEHAEMLPASPARDRLLTFVIVGGGPTGVELAGAIAELARKALATDFRNIDPRGAHIVLVEAGPRLLPSFPDKLSTFAARALTRLGVDVRLGKPMTACDANGVTIGRRAAVIDFGWLRLKGALAWWIWGIAHIYFLIGFRNRIIVALQWLWSYLMFERGARLIMGNERKDVGDKNIAG